MEIFLRKRKLKEDVRGTFIEILRREDTGIHEFGQLSISTAHPGQTKGGHYHKRKREWYYLIKGNAKLTFTNRITAETKEIFLNSTERQLIEIPINVIHTTTNIGPEELILLVYITEPYYEKDPDTYTI